MDIDYIRRKAEDVPRALQHAAAKEALQECILAALARKGRLASVCFIGGTALRILHGLPRYSEDLDFICNSESGDSDLADWPTTLAKAVSTIGATAHMGTPRVQQIEGPAAKRLYGLHLAVTSPAFSKFAKQGLQVSLEVDMTPPSHTSPEVKTLALAGEQVTLPSLTLPSLMAGKLHILLTRLDREKGRDWFDYLWYRKNGVTPNVLQLQSAIDQTNPGLDAIYWMSHIRAKAKAVNWENIRADVSPFLENQEEAKGLSEAKVSVHTPYPDFSALGVEVASANPSHRVFRRGDYVRADIDQAAMEGLEEAMDLRKAIFDREIRSRVGGPDLVG